jgi:NDP-sugar pyrophosphorylase family protein
MAGSSSRFRAMGFDSPKFMLFAKGRSLFSWSMESLRHFFGFEFVFITLHEHRASKFIEQECAELGISKFTIHTLPELTDGQASTVLSAKELVAPSDEIAIYNIDTYVEAIHLRPESIQGDGWLPCFDCQGDHFSFVSLELDGKVKEIAEKIRISPYGTIGLYYFSSFDLFKYSFEVCSFAGVKEKFVAPLYSVLLQEGMPVYGSLIPSSAVFVLGTPAEVVIFDPLFLTNQNNYSAEMKRRAAGRDLEV